MKYYIYILYSVKFDKYYIGYTHDIFKRLETHNTSNENTFTSKYRPWELKVAFYVGDQRSEAMRIERFIKKQKSRSILIKLIDVNFVPTGELVQLIRVPHIRN